MQGSSDESAKEAQRAAAARSVASTIESASRGRGAFGVGEVAALRRMNIDRPPSVFWKMFGDKLSFVQDEDVSRWALAAKGMATLGGSSQDIRFSPGAALAEAGYSSSSTMRMDKLCSSEGKAFETLFIAACSQLAQKAQGLDWGRFIEFIVSTDQKARDQAIRNLQRDFHTPRRTS